MNRRFLVPIVVLTLSIAGMAYGTVLFTHTFPSTVVSLPAISSDCQLLVASSPSGPGSGTIRFACSSGNTFNVLQSTVSITPMFSLTGTDYTAISLVAAGSGTCAMTTPLTSGTSITRPIGTYDYCAIYNTGDGTLGTFTMAWDQ